MLAWGLFIVSLMGAANVARLQKQVIINPKIKKNSNLCHMIRNYNSLISKQKLAGRRFKSSPRTKELLWMNAASALKIT
jgi:hypothetical protein